MKTGQNAGPQHKDSSGPCGDPSASLLVEGVNGGRGKGECFRGDDCDESSGIVCDRRGRAHRGHVNAHVGGNNDVTGGVLARDSSGTRNRSISSRNVDAQQQQHPQQEQQEYQQQEKDKLWLWRQFLALCCVFSFSSLVHEAVTFVAMRWTCWPFNSFALVTAAIVIASWDAMYPVQYLITPGEAISPPPTVAAATTGKHISPKNIFKSSAGVSRAGGNGPNNLCPEYSAGVSCANRNEPDNADTHGGMVAGRVAVDGGMEGRRATYRKVGSEWRGWGAVAFFEGCSIPMGLFVDFLAWQWWRQTLKE